VALFPASFIAHHEFTNFAHELMVAEITASIELGTKEHLTFV